MNVINIVRAALVIAGCLLMIWFIIPGFLTGTFNIGTVTGAGISAAMILYGIFLPGIHKLIRFLWIHVGGKILLIILIAAIATIIILAGACSFSMIKGALKTAGDNCTVIVLGAKIKDTRVSYSLAGRLDAAYEYLLKNPDSVCIVSGGQGDDEVCTEASLMYDYLCEKGIEPQRIYIEDQSTDTDENLAYSKKIIEENGLDPHVGIATDEYHEYRAISYAGSKGIDAAAIPSKTVWWLWPTSVIREMYGILEMWFLK